MANAAFNVLVDSLKIKEKEALNNKNFQQYNINSK